MYETNTNGQKLYVFFHVLWPLLITQIGLYAMSLFDTMMSGRVSAEDLAGVAIATNLWLPIFTGINGILLGVSPVISHLLGSGQKRFITGTVTQGVYLSVVLALVVIILGAPLLMPVLNLMALEPAVLLIVKQYLIGLSFGIIPLFVSSLLRTFFDALGNTRITMLIILISVPLNIFFNYVLIFGKWGMPKLGGIGAGYATSITYWIILLISIYVVYREPSIAPYQIFKEKVKPSLAAWIEQLRIGVPIGLSIFFEVSIFAAVTLLMTQFSTITIAAHQAALNFASLIFMVPLSISMALTIAVGFEAGAGRIAAAVQYSKMGIQMAIYILIVCSIGLYVFRGNIAMLYSNDPAVIELTKKFLVFSIFYQLSDALQSSIQGVLRGYKDVKTPFVMALVSYWVIGLPVGFVLANFTTLRPFGYWIGITLGLTTAAIFFIARLNWIQKGGKRNEPYFNYREPV